MTYEEALQLSRKISLEQNKISVSLIKKWVGCTYPSAATIIDEMVLRGMCTPPDLVGKRKVLNENDKNGHKSDDIRNTGK